MRETAASILTTKKLRGFAARNITRFLLVMHLHWVSVLP